MTDLRPPERDVARLAPDVLLSTRWLRPAGSEHSGDIVAAAGPIVTRPMRLNGLDATERRRLLEALERISELMDARDDDVAPVPSASTDMT